MIIYFYIMSVFAALVLLVDTVIWETRKRLGHFDEPIVKESDLTDAVTAVLFAGKSTRLISRQYGIKLSEIWVWKRGVH